MADSKRETALAGHIRKDGHIVGNIYVRPSCVSAFREASSTARFDKYGDFRAEVAETTYEYVFLYNGYTKSTRSGVSISNDQIDSLESILDYWTQKRGSYAAYLQVEYKSLNFRLDYYPPNKEACSEQIYLREGLLPDDTSHKHIASGMKRLYMKEFPEEDTIPVDESINHPGSRLHKHCDTKRRGELTGEGFVLADNLIVYISRDSIQIMSDPNDPREKAWSHSAVFGESSLKFLKDVISNWRKEYWQGPIFPLLAA